MPSSPVLEFREITPADANNRRALAAFLKKNEAYFLLFEKRDIDEASVAEIMTALPPERSTAQKQQYLVYLDGALAAFLDLLKNYPEPGTWNIGYLIVEESLRGRGLGACIAHQVEGWLQKAAGSAIRIGVHRENELALKFWRSMGFEIQTGRDISVAGQQLPVFVLTKKIK